MKVSFELVTLIALSLVVAVLGYNLFFTDSPDSTKTVYSELADIQNTLKRLDEENKTAARAFSEFYKNCAQTFQTFDDKLLSQDDKIKSLEEELAKKNFGSMTPTKIQLVIKEPVPVRVAQRVAPRVAPKKK